MSVSTRKTATPAAKSPAQKAPASVPATKAQAKPPAKKTQAKAPVKVKTPAVTKKTSREAMLARVEAVRMEQRSGGHFDCFGRAGEGYCDQGNCAYHAECLSVSRLLHSL